MSIEKRNTAAIEGRDFGGQRQKIAEAVTSGNVDQVVLALTDANNALTGNDSSHFSSGAGMDNLRRSLATFFQEIATYGDARVAVYLGDSGISRLIIERKRDGTVRIEPTKNSSETVKAAWEKLQ